MTHRKTHRNRTRRHRTRRNTKNVFNKTLNTSVGMVKSTSRRYMPKVKSGLENVGSSVIKRGKETVPYLQRLTRKIFGKFGVKK